MYVDCLKEKQTRQSRFTGFFRDNIYYLLIFLLLNNVVTVLGYRGFWPELPQSVLETLIIVLLASLIPVSFIKKAVLGVFMLIFIITVHFEVFYYLEYKVVPDKSVFVIMMASNPREMAEYFSMYWHSSLMALFVVILSCLAAFFLARLIKKWTDGKLFVLGAVLAAAAAYAFAADAAGCAQGKSADCFFRQAAVFRYYQYVSGIKADMRDYAALKSRPNDNIVIQSKKSDVPLLIIVLGEALNREHMSIYGYYNDTTPLLRKRAQAGELTAFSDVISADSTTTAVMENLFNFSRKGEGKRWFEYNNLFEILRACGYKTVWLSNQESGGAWGNIGKIYADACDYSKFLGVRPAEEAKKISPTYYDGDLLPELRKNLQANGFEGVYVLHLMGEHGMYNFRYPKEYNKFTAKDEKSVSEFGREMRAAYDNAVLYNDYVVDEIIKSVENKNAIVIFMPDHGEEVYDNREFAGHMIASATTHYMVEIPMLVWMSGEFRQEHQKLAARIDKAKDRPFMTDDIIHVILDIMSVTTHEYDPARSVINEQYNAERKRCIGGRRYVRNNGKGSIEGEL